MPCPGWRGGLDSVHVDRLGSEMFGVLTLIWGLIGYFSLFGVGRALTFQLSHLGATCAELDVGSLLRAGLQLTAAAGLAGEWLARQDDARIAFLVAAVGVLATVLASGLREAMERDRQVCSVQSESLCALCRCGLCSCVVVLKKQVFRRLKPVAVDGIKKNVTQP